MNKLFGVLSAAAIFGSAPAYAATCQFTMAGVITEPGQFAGAPLLANFVADCSPVPTSVNSGVGYFQIDNVPGVFNGPGVAGNFGTGVGPITLGDIQFYTADAGGGFEVNYAANDPDNAGFGLFSLLGGQLFSGTLDNPTFTPGVYNFTQDFFYGSATATLTIAQLGVAGVPEPATWAMMLLGFGAVGTVLRRRQSSVLASA